MSIDFQAWLVIDGTIGADVVQPLGTYQDRLLHREAGVFIAPAVDVARKKQRVRLESSDVKPRLAGDVGKHRHHVIDMLVPPKPCPKLLAKIRQRFERDNGMTGRRSEDDGSPSCRDRPRRRRRRRCDQATPQARRTQPRYPHDTIFPASIADPLDIERPLHPCPSPCRTMASRHARNPVRRDRSRSSPGAFHAAAFVKPSPGSAKLANRSIRSWESRHR